MKRLLIEDDKDVALYALLRGVLDATPDFIFVKDCELRNLLCNEAYARALGKRPEELYGKTDIENGWAPESVKGDPARGIRGFEQDDRDALGGKVVHNPCHPANVEGRIRLFDTLKVPLRDANGDLIGVLGIARDITERREAEEALWDSEAQYRRIVDTANEGIWVLDENFITTFVNRHMSRMLGYDESEMIGRPVHWFMFEEDLADVQKRMRDRRMGISDRYERRYRRKDGGVVWFTLSVTPLVDDKDGSFKGSFSMVTDISDRKKVEEEIRRLNVDLEQRVRDRTAELAATNASLRESEEKYRTLIETTDTGYLIVDSEGGVIDANREYLRVSGYGRLEEILGRSVIEWTAEHDRERNAAEVMKCVQRGYVRDLEIDYVDKHGRVTPVEINATAIGSGPSRQIVSLCRDITERKRARAERERLMAAIEQAGEIVIITDPEGKIRYVNPTFETVTGYTRREVLGRTPRILQSGIYDEAFYRELWETISSGRTWQGRMVNKRKDGTLYTADATISPVRDASGRIVNYVAVNRDITEDLRLAAEFQQAQKMESIGRLAGGVAHDFNNMLGVIFGYVDLALVRAGAESPLYDNLTQIKNAATRAADLTRQLLAFARKQTIAPKVLDLNTTVEGMLNMLRRLIGENIDLAWMPDSGLWPVKMDPAQIDQILANLFVNARDAIADVGKVTIETENIILDEAFCTGHEGFPPGEFVMLAVSDNGCGMTEETKRNLFEPFFTTKGVGKGTGLGLSTVYGIVKQNNGHIDVYSELGHGTTFKIYIPRHGEGKVETGDGTWDEPTRGRGETVLMVEDERAMLEIGMRLLETLGYTVLGASTPDEAIRLAGEHTGKINLLLTDVVMPEMNGRELAQRLLVKETGMKCLFTSGYTADVIARHGVLDEGVQFIQKPFSMKELATKVQMALDA